MKILLVQPKKPDLAFGGDEFSFAEPLALEYVAGAVRGEHEVRLLDLRVENRLAETVDSFQPDVVGITAYTIHVNGVNDLFEEIKGIDPKILTVVGGHHATIAYRDFLTPFVDLVIIGEGGIPFREAMRRFEDGESFEGIPGVIYREGDQVMVQEQAQYDLDSVPFPDRSITKAYRQHYYAEWMKPLASLRTSKGCPFRCNFCSLWGLTDKYMTRSPENVVEELRQIEEPWVFLADDESFIRVDRMTELAKHIKKSGIRKRFYAYVRADTVVRQPEMIRLWREIGLERVFIGFEFFRDGDLKGVNKGGSAAKNIEAADFVRSLGIDLYAAFIVKPDWEKEDFRALQQFCRDRKFDFVGITVLTPLPGTQLFEELKDQMVVRNYDYYDLIHTLLPTKLPIKEFYEEYLALWLNAVSPKLKLSLLKKYSLRELPASFGIYSRFKRQFKTLHKDYDDLDSVNAAQRTWVGDSESELESEVVIKPVAEPRPRIVA